ncbi:MAG: Rpn family recombination-promoting nuclease/putative transposase [Spirosomaceae bacterium]|nr:Rpn family recombination-promoting nuclease/putative transposase [Spirosomataceae bacterium]
MEDVFDDFLRFFFKNAEELFDFEQPFEFLDKELEQLFPIDPDDFSPKYVDKLVKVFTKQGEEQWILVHIEVQGKTDKGFAERMFQYFYRIYDKYQRPITAFAILTDGNKRFHPKHFEQRYLGTSLQYNFNTYKVLEQDATILAESNNPFAMVILTVWMALKKGKISEDELLSEKISLAKRLLVKQFSKGKIRALMNFLKLYIRFSSSEKSVNFEQKIEILTNKTKKTMGIEEFVLNRAERIGEKRGEKRGENTQKLKFVKSLITQTDFDDAKIAALTAVDVATVQRLRKQ